MGVQLRTPGEDLGTPFRVSLRIHWADVPELSAPGLMARPELRLVVLLGQVEKRTEPAVYTVQTLSRGNSMVAVLGLACVADQGERDGRDTRSSGADADAGPWAFDDTLTFAARLSDVLGVRICLQLVARNDVHLGPVQVRLPGEQSLGEASLDLRDDILGRCGVLACKSGNTPGRPRQTWTTPEFVVPFATSAGQAVAGSTSIGSGRKQPRLAVTCTVNTNPQALLREAYSAELSLVDKVVQQAHCLQGQQMFGTLSSCATRVSVCNARSPGMRQKGLAVESSPRMRRRRGGYDTCEVPSSLISSYDEDGSSPMHGQEFSGGLFRDMLAPQVSGSQRIKPPLAVTDWSTDEEGHHSERLLTKGLRIGGG